MVDSMNPSTLAAKGGQHTSPLPWTVREGVFIDAPGMRDVAQFRGAVSPYTQTTGMANAALCARAVNSHAELLAALSELERIVSAHPSFQNEWTYAASAIGQARAAIAKAEAST